MKPHVIQLRSAICLLMPLLCIVWKYPSAHTLLGPMLLTMSQCMEQLLKCTFLCTHILCQPVQWSGSETLSTGSLSRKWSARCRLVPFVDYSQAPFCSRTEPAKKTQIQHAVGSTGVFLKIFLKQIHIQNDRQTGSSCCSTSGT